MSFPAYRSHTVGGSTASATAPTVSAAVPAGTIVGDYQLVVVSLSSGSMGLGVVANAADWAELTAAGGVLVSSSGASPDHGGSQRIAIYQSTTSVAAFSLTTTGSGLWATARVSWSLPSGSTGRTVAMGQAVEAAGASATVHATPAVSTVSPESVVIGIGVQDLPTASAWSDTGAWSQRVIHTVGAVSGNPTQSIAIGDTQVSATTSGVTANFTSAAADSVAMFAIVLNGVAASGTPPIVGVDADINNWTVGTQFTRTATETGGGGITDRIWEITAGPAGVTVPSTIGIAAALSWTPTVVGTYTLRYTATNPSGSDSDLMSFTVVAAGGGAALDFEVLQQNKGFVTGTTAATYAAALASAPGASNLVISCTSLNKNATTLTAAAPFTARQTRFTANESGGLASAVGQQSCSWTRGAREAAWGIFETNLTDAVFQAANFSPATENTTDVETIAGDLGTVAYDGVVFAMVSVDSSWDAAVLNTGAWPNGAADISWTNGFETVAVVQTGTAEGDIVGGAAFALGRKILTATDRTTSTTCSWVPGNTDQAFMIMAGYSATTTGGGGDPGGTPGTVVRDPRIGIDRIHVMLSGGSGDVELHFSTNSSLTSPVASVAVTPDAQGNAHVPLPAGLAEDTVYYFRPYRAETYIGTIKSFRTLPGAAQTSTVVAFGSCRATDADAPILSQVAARNARLMLFTGDQHYRDINSTNAALYRTADDEFYGQASIKPVLTSIPNDQTWSDHDFCGNASHAGMVGKATVRQVFRERVPTPALPSPSGGIYHSFKFWGDRVRFIVLDTRSFRDSIGTTADGTMLGSEQLTWLQNLLDAPDTALTFIVSAEGWHSPGTDDDWGFYQNERTTISGWITASDTECVFLCGDWHYLAYATPAQSTPGGVHVWHAAALNQFDNGSKGGTFVTSPASHAPSYTTAGQLGFISLVESGSQITATFTGARQGTSDWGGTDSVTVSTAGIEPGRFFLASA